MSTKIKHSLIKCLQNIRPLQNPSKPEIDKTIDILKQDAATIKNDQQGRYEACHFLRLLFTATPTLMTPENKQVLNKFAKEIKLDEILDNKIRPNKKQ